jgi:hypothetical protein
MEAQHANQRGGLAARVTLVQDREIARISAYSKDSQYIPANRPGQDSS